MDYIYIILISIGLCFDTFAVSVSSGIARQEIKFYDALKIALVLSVFQGGMPLIGWFLGENVKHLVSGFDHWVVFGILAFLGIKMIKESFKHEGNEKFDPLNILILLGLGLATSIDALAVGISFSLIDLPILVTVIIIGSVTLFTSMLGILFGKKTGFRFGRKMKVIGGLILIAIGVKILIQHLWV